LQIPLKIFGGHFDIDVAIAKIASIEAAMNESTFWDDPSKSQVIVKNLKVLKDQVTQFEEINELIDECNISLEMLEDESDSDFLELLELDYNKLLNLFDVLSNSLLYSEEYDRNDAILEIHPGAGGTESMDWAEMLFRMYQRWFDKKNYSYEILEYQAGEITGIKRLTIIVKGHNAYGNLKGEKGVHRLVRISPFDSSGKRHTSFASIYVVPSVDDEINIDIKVSDLKIDTYRASGAGGQSVNTTDSAVRITHLPTNVVVTCQNERSQIKNKERAMKILKSKLFQLEQEKQNEMLEAFKGNKSQIAFGSQIRSYVFHPYSLVKDHRTNFEVGNSKKVLDGDLDEFILEYLRSL